MLSVKMGAKIVGIEFTGGSRQPRRLKPKYTTGNKEVQDAIERTPQFKKGKIKIKKAVDAAPRVSAESSEIRTQAVSDDLKKVPGITKVQDAKEYLIDNKEVKAADLPNKAEVIKVAAENGIAFPDLG